MVHRIVGWLILLCFSLTGAGKVCNLTLNLCPSRYPSGPIQIPSDVIWLDPKVPYCNEVVQLSANAPTASIVFIIDNSGSMDKNDPEVARFKVVSNLIQNIYTAAPATKVGLVIFTRRLAFDYLDNNFFHKAFPTDTSQHDAYVPLTALNATFPGNRLGRDTLMALLKHDRGGNLVYNTQRIASRNNSSIEKKNTRDGTDITLGFLAARMAMNEIKADSSRQFFIFLSDGNPTGIDAGRDDFKNNFVEGKATPTTFTLYFDSAKTSPVVPTLIEQMTKNISKNGYSSSNVKSAYYATNLPGQQLEDILQTQVLGRVIFLPTTPKKGMFSIGEKSFSNTSIVGKDFVFGNPIPLSAASPITQVSLNFTYNYSDSSGGKNTPKEKIVPYFLSLQRTEGAPMPVGMVKSCQEQGSITLLHAGKKITAITAEDSLLEAHLTFPPGRSCLNCTLAITPTSPRSKDSLTLPVNRTGDFFSGTFQRETNTIPKQGDFIFQHLASDSLIISWVNPENPLEEIRKAYRFINIASILGVKVSNFLAKIPNLQPQAYSEWTIMGPPGLRIESVLPNRWKLNSGTLSREDSLSHIPITLEATRSFTADIHVYSNHGNLISQLKFSLSPREFEKLAKPASGPIRSLRLYWDNRTLDGNVVGTGAFIIKTILNLSKIADIADDHAEKTTIHKVGVLRE